MEHTRMPSPFRVLGETAVGSQEQTHPGGLQALQLS